MLQISQIYADLKRQRVEGFVKRTGSSVLGESADVLARAGSASKAAGISAGISSTAVTKHVDALESKLNAKSGSPPMLTIEFVTATAELWFPENSENHSHFLRWTKT